MTARKLFAPLVTVRKRGLRSAFAAALEAIASVQPDVDRFFNEVRVVVPDEKLKNTRLSLLADFRDAVSDQEIGMS